MFAKRFYVIAGLLVCLGVGAMVITAPAPADPVRPAKEWDLTGYPATVCSVFVNNENARGTASYTEVEVPTGMTIGKIVIHPVETSAALAFTMRCWASTTDSSGAYLSLAYPSGASAELTQEFNIQCKKISFVNVIETDDFVVCAYCYF